MVDTNSISKYILSEIKNKCPHNKLGYRLICVFIKKLFMSLNTCFYTFNNNIS